MSTLVTQRQNQEEAVSVIAESFNMDLFALRLDHEPPLKRMRVEDTVTNSLQGLLNSHLSSHSDDLFSEICTLQQRLTSHNQLERERDVQKCDESDLPDVLKSALSSGDHTENSLTPEVCMQRLLAIIQRAGDNAQKVCLLSTEQRVELGVVLSLFKSLKEQQAGRWSELVGCLTKEYLPIEVVWQLHTNNIVSVQAIFDSVLRDRRKCAHLAKQLIHLCTIPKDGVVNLKILSVVCSHLVQNGFPEKKSEDMIFRKVCISVLDGVTRELFDGHMYDTDLLLHTDLHSETTDIPHVSFKKFCTHTISLIMSHRSNMKVSDALKRQMQWKSGKIPDNFKSLYKQLLVPFDSLEVVEMLRRILEKQEVNWQTLLSFLATFLVCFPAAAKDIKEHVSKLLTESLEGGDMENTIVAFLLARQSCREGIHVFPAYAQWFQEMFGVSAASPAGSKKAFTFLIKFLTDLVPYEPADILRVHILHPPFVPAKCRDLWTDYTMLAKTRLADLKVPLEETNSAIYAGKGNAGTSTAPGLQDVEKAVAVFESSGKLPTTVMEASIFRKPYFVGKFLPALLQPRHLPDMPDSRMKFIEALKNAGKVPSAMFAKYEEACRRETRQLLEGVFEMEEDDGVEEMMMDPSEQLAHRLKQLTDTVISQSTESRVSEIVSILSEKIGAVVCPSPDTTVLANHACVVDLCQPTLLPSHVQVVDEVLNCVCRTVHIASDASQQCWLHQLVRMISQHVTLLPALFTRLLTLFSSKNGSLSQHHIKGVAAFIFHVVNNTTQFPPLLVKTQSPEGKQDVPFLPLFLQCLPVSTEKEMMVAFMFLANYLRVAFLCASVNSADCGDMEAVLPRQLMVMTCLLSWRFLPETRSILWSELPVPQSWPHLKMRDRGTVFDSTQDYIKSVIAALFASEKFQEIVKANRPTLEDWLYFELKVVPSQDLLSSLQRQTYHHTMVGHFSLGQRVVASSDCGSSGSHLQETCFVMMSVLVKALSRSHWEPGKCSVCQTTHQPVTVNPSATHVNPHAITDLLMLLSKLTQNVHIATDSNEGKEPWLVEQVLQLLRQPAQDAVRVIPEAVQRVVLSCPSYLLFTNSASQAPNMNSAAGIVRLLKEFLVSSAAEGGVLTLDVTCHLLQGYMAATADGKAGTAVEVFENHPLMVLSTLVHWHCVSALVPALSKSSPWERFPACLDMFDRFCNEGQSLSLPTRDPFCLAASLYAAVLYRDHQCKPEKRKALFSHLHQQVPKALGCLSDILLVSLSDSSICSSTLSHKAEIGLQWMSELWGLFPHLVISSFSSGPESSPLRHSLMSADQVPFTEVAILRSVSRLAPEKIAGEKGLMRAVVCLYARLCHRFEDQCTSQQGTDVTVILDLSKTVLVLLKVAPFSFLQSVNQEDVRQCGLDAHHILQQRLKNRT